MKWCQMRELGLCHGKCHGHAIVICSRRLLRRVHILSDCEADLALGIVDCMSSRMIMKDLESWSSREVFVRRSCVWAVWTATLACLVCLPAYGHLRGDFNGRQPVLKPGGCIITIHQLNYGNTKIFHWLKAERPVWLFSVDRWECTLEAEWFTVFVTSCSSCYARFVYCRILWSFWKVPICPLKSSI